MRISEMYNAVEDMSQQPMLSVPEVKLLNRIQIELDCQWDNLGELADQIQDRIDFCRTINIYH